MITMSNGDLLSADVDALVNTVNCVGVMGKGIALQFKRRYPGNFQVYADACKRGEVRLGHMFVHDLGTLDRPRWIINFPTKAHWRTKSRIGDIERGLSDLVRAISEHGIKSIAVPPLGAGNGGLDWADVEPLVREALGALKEVDVHLYAPAKAHHSIAGEPMHMTWGRSTFLQMIDRYVQHRAAVEPWEDPRGASALEIQKIMYFADLVQPDLRLRYTQGRYGPYSDIVRVLLQGMEGTFTTGFGDGSARALDLEPIAVTEVGIAEARRQERADEIKHDIISPALSITEGFEGPFGVELLASVHWVANHQDARTVDTAVAAIRGWTARKASIFDAGSIAAALERLRERNLIPA